MSEEEIQKLQDKLKEDCGQCDVEPLPNVGAFILRYSSAFHTAAMNMEAEDGVTGATDDEVVHAFGIEVDVLANIGGKFGNSVKKNLKPNTVSIDEADGIDTFRSLVKSQNSDANIRQVTNRQTPTDPKFAEQYGMPNQHNE